MHRSLVAVFAAGLVAACSSPPHRCPADTLTKNCAPMEEIYQQAQREMRAQGAKASAGAPGSVSFSETAPATLAGQEGMPVFKQPTVFRAFVEPYVDADGNLRGGEYVFFSTPGEWNYGTLRRPGQAAAGMFAPLKPDQLGFKPAPQQTAQQPPKPDAAPAATAPAAPGPNTPQNVGPITQPYQRLN